MELDNMVTPFGDRMHLTLFVDVAPINYVKVIEENVWRIDMEEETKVIKKNHTWN